MSDEPLTWPGHYPPATAWKRFFLGVRRLGPDLSFLQELRDRQASRGPQSLEAWPDDAGRRLAMIVGQALVGNGLGWETPIFVPGDQFAVMLHGPRFRQIDDFGRESAIREIEQKVGRTFPEEFWRESGSLSFGDVVGRMLEQLDDPRMANRARGRGEMGVRWRFLLGGVLKLLAAAVCLVGSVGAYRLLLHPAIESAFSLGAHASSIVRRVNIFVVVILSYWAFVRYFERRAVKELSLRWRWILLAAAAGALSIGVSILALYATGHYRLESFRGFGQAGGVLATIWIAAVMEEVAFRGILFRILEERTGTRAALAGSAMIFGAVHLTNNGARWITLVSVTLAGLMWAGVFIVSRNIWVVAAHHCCWNATIFLIGLPLSGEDWRAQAPLATVPHGSPLWTGGAFGPEDSLVSIAVSVAICAALWRLSRRLGQVSAAPLLVDPAARAAVERRSP